MNSKCFERNVSEVTLWVGFQNWGLTWTLRLRPPPLWDPPLANTKAWARQGKEAHITGPTWLRLSQIFAPANLTVSGAAGMRRGRSGWTTTWSTELWELALLQQPQLHYGMVTDAHRDTAESELTFTYGFGQESEAVEILHFCPDTQRFPGVMYGYIGVYSQLTL